MADGSRPKVFGIGFHKTGTTSLRRALEMLGYRVTGPVARDHPDPAAVALDLCTEASYRFDAFQDNPWPLFYAEMDALHPGSKFVLTERPSHEWIRSVTEHFGTTDTPMREWIYGIGHPVGNESTYVERYERHNREVRQFFADRPEDLLVMAVTGGEGWEALAGFLGVPVPAEPFPRANTAGYRGERQARSRMAKAWRRLRSG